MILLKKIEREDIDLVKWNALVNSEKTQAVFSHSDYLDVTAKNWCVFVLGDYEGGIAIPYVDQLGVKSVYTPIFVRYLQWIGKNQPKNSELLHILKSEFKAGHLAYKADVISESPYRYQQIIPSEEIKLNQQAKRMIKKFDQSGMVVINSEDIQEVLKHIRDELPEKIKSLGNQSLDNLEKLTKNLNASHKLEILIVKEDNKIRGGIFLVRSNNTLLYLKGAFNKSAKDRGAMYKTMITAIENAKSEGLIFDFGGSRVDGVSRFNYNLGGKDVFYEMIEWNHAPFWFKLLKKGKTLIRRH